MGTHSPAVHRAIVAVDVAGFGHQQRNNPDRIAIRDGLYGALKTAFRQSGIPWNDRDHGDSGDGLFVLIGPDVPKSVLAELLPGALAGALRQHNSTHSDWEKIRLRMALHAGEVNYDEHGVTAASIDLTFRLLESPPLKAALAGSSGVLAVIASAWFFEEVIRHNDVNAAGYTRVPVMVKETATTGWICLPDDESSRARPGPGRSPSRGRPADRPAAESRAGSASRALARAYVSALEEPITPSGDLPAGLEMPTLGEGYVDQRIRVGEVTSSSDPGVDSWWTDKPASESACEFLLANLSAPRALAAPVVLLGQPGSGKSVLTRILAARLSATGFLPVRVELRKAAAEADLQVQIEGAVRGATGEAVPWPDISGAADGMPPVVIFDGFDELLQATGVTQSDFLLRVREFQEREARLGRPLAVIVTSRLAVTGQARFPAGATAIRLEPFDAGQVSAWLDRWAEANRDCLAGRGLSPLPAAVALRYGELAEQPILLLMLALHDADANALQGSSALLSQTELYSRLLRDFAGREIRKTAPALPDQDLERAVEAELLRLSVVAFAMFNRRSQRVSEADLNADLSALLGEEPAQYPGAGPRHDGLTAAQLAVGRFFFVHEARSARGDQQLRTYEFLHATFGEYLVARLVVDLLAEMPPPGRPSAAPSRPGAESEMLFALLSYAALTARGPVIAFLTDLLSQLSAGQRAAVAETVLELHQRAEFRQDAPASARYQPLVLPPVARYAAWSANLVVIAVLAAGEVAGRELYPQAPDAQHAWRAEALVWRSQLAGYGWEGLHESISFTRLWDGQQKEFRLGRGRGESPPQDFDMGWTFSHAAAGWQERREVFSSFSHSTPMALRKINFAGNMSEDVMAHGLAPLVSVFPSTAHVLIALHDGRTVSAVHALVAALGEPYREGGVRDSVYLDLAEVTGKLAQVANAAQDAPFQTMALGVLASAADQGLVSRESLEEIAGLRLP